MFRQETHATVYDTQTGDVLHTVDFAGRKQLEGDDDSFVGSDDTLFALNQDGTMLASSFTDGTLSLFHLDDGTSDDVYATTPAFSHYEGGFYRKYLAFAVSSETEDAYVVANTDTQKQTIQQKDAPMGVQTDEDGIYLQYENALVQIDPVSGEMTALAATDDRIMHFARDRDYTLTVSGEKFQIFDEEVNLVAEGVCDNRYDYVQLRGKTAVLGSLDAPTLRLLCYGGDSESEFLRYDNRFMHNEARVASDGQSVTLFSVEGFQVWSREGSLLSEGTFPNPDKMLNKQFFRNDTGDVLKITYRDGRIDTYAIPDGTLQATEYLETVEQENETFTTEQYRIESPVHGTPQIYDIRSEALLCTLEEDAYLTNVFETEQGLVVQYSTMDGSYIYGHLLNKDFEVVAELPWLCDVWKDTFFYDCPSGVVRRSPIYDLDTLLEIARTEET